MLRQRDILCSRAIRTYSWTYGFRKFKTTEIVKKSLLYISDKTECVLMLRTKRRRRSAFILLVFLFGAYTLSTYGYNKTRNIWKSYDMPQETCSSEHCNMTLHIAYLKVPKTGSSTLQNILFRFGIKNNLSIYVPNSSYVVDKREQNYLLTKAEHYDIFAIHTVYNSNFFKNFPSKDSITIGLIRDPYDRFISAAYYMRDIVHSKYLEQVPRNGYIQNLLGNSEMYDKGYFSPTRNLMAKYFGFTEPFTVSNTVQIKQYLDKMNSEILLILILEKFDESLLLFRRLLNWSFSDILYKRMNAHEHEAVTVDNILMEKLKNTSFLDYQIYNYFSTELDNKIKSAGPMFETELKYFKDILKKANSFCSGSDNNSIFVIPNSIWEKEFTVTPNDCRKMNTNDTEFLKMIRLGQTHLL